MTLGCNIDMICLKLNWLFYDTSRILQFSQFVWTPCYSEWDVFNNFLLIDATDRSKISSDQKRFFIALSLYTLSFFANTPFNVKKQRFVQLYLTTISPEIQILFPDNLRQNHHSHTFTLSNLVSSIDKDRLRIRRHFSSWKI